MTHHVPIYWSKIIPNIFLQNIRATGLKIESVNTKIWRLHKHPISFNLWGRGCDLWVQWMGSSYLFPVWTDINRAKSGRKPLLKRVHWRERHLQEQEGPSHHRDREERGVEVWSPLISSWEGDQSKAQEDANRRCGGPIASKTLFLAILLDFLQTEAVRSPPPSPPFWLGDCLQWVWILIPHPLLRTH